MLMTIKVSRGGIEEELVAVCRELQTQPSTAYLPRLFLKLGLEAIRIAEKNFHLDCGPTAGCDAAFIARKLTSENERAIAAWQDMRAAVYTIVRSGSRQQAEVMTDESLAALLPDIAAFLQQELAEINLSELIKNFYTSMGATAEITSASIRKLITANRSNADLEKFAAWVMQHEKIANFRVYEVIAAYMQAYRRGIAEVKRARGERSAVRAQAKK
jgi:hypothetical protein